MEVPAVPYRDLKETVPSASSAEIGKRVAGARDIQTRRFTRAKIFCNAQMNSRHIKKHCTIGDKSHRLLETAIDKLGLSARAYNRILKISRTIADLEGKGTIGAEHISEAIQYRSLDRGKGLT